MPADLRSNLTNHVGDFGVAHASHATCREFRRIRIHIRSQTTEGHLSLLWRGMTEYMLVIEFKNKSFLK